MIDRGPPSGGSSSVELAGFPQHLPHAAEQFLLLACHAVAQARLCS